MTELHLPTLAVLGRPNVGKSLLVNALTRTQLAIVDDSRGVTRDRLLADADIDGVLMRVMDTGGFEPDSSDPLMQAMREQAELAIEESDVILLLVDGRDGVMPADRELVSLLRRSKRPCILAVNKIDDRHHEHEAHAFYELGMDPLVSVSAMHRRGFDDLAAALRQILPDDLLVLAETEPENDGEGLVDSLELVEQAQQDEASLPESTLPEEICVAIVGRPNVGKSSLINSLLGESRLLVADLPGTTRDSVDTVLEYGERRYRIVDTAGIRRKRSITHRLERYSVVASFRAMARAHVVVLVVDASQPVSDQDQRVCARAQDAGKALVLVANKMDRIKELDRSRKDILLDVRDQLRFADHATLVTTVATRGRNVFGVLQAVEALVPRYFKRIRTSEVNRVIEELSRHHPPPVVAKARAKLLFGAQVAVAPPTFVIVSRRPDAILRAYRKYVERRLRETFGFDGVPLIVAFRSRKRQTERSKIYRKKAKTPAP